MSFRTKVFVFLSVMMLSVLPTFAQDTTVEGVVESMKDMRNLSKFADLIEFLGIDARYNNIDLFFTVFALEDDQVDALFEDLGYDFDDLEDLEDGDRLVLSAILTYHFMPGAYNQATFDAVEDFVGGPLTLASVLSGTTITYDRGELNDSAEIIEGDIVGGNGIIHIIDKYILPSQDSFSAAIDILTADVEVLENQSDEDSIADYLEDNDEFSMIREAYDTAGLLDDLDDKSPYTIFIMTDRSLEAALENANLNWDDILEDTEALNSILTLHILPGQFTTNSLKELDQAFIGTMLPYTVSQVTVDGRDLFLSGVEITDTDIVANNGIIHVIDGVILPPGN